MRAVILDEREFTLGQVDQAQADLYAIADDLDFIRIQLTHLPTRNELARVAVLIGLGLSVLALVGFEAWWRYVSACGLT